MRISQISLKNVGPFDDAVFEFPEPKQGTKGELVLFEGPNGSGKTTLIEGIAGALAHQTSPQRSRARLRDQTSSIVVGVADGTSSGTLELRLSSGMPIDRLTGACQLRRDNLRGNGDAPIDWAAFSYRAHLDSPVLAVEGPRPIANSPPLLGALSFGDMRGVASPDPHALFGQLLINLQFELLQANDAAADPATRRALSEARRTSLERIAATLGEVIDREVRFDFPFGQHHATMTVDGEAIPLELLGEGMRSTVAWVADLLLRIHRISWVDAAKSPLDQDFWLLLDEVEESLHPTLQARLFPALRTLFPNARIYATTHSPFVVASVTDGVVFPIRPDRKTHHVSGSVQPERLEPGQSLEYVVTEIFEAQAGFVDEQTRLALAEHKADVRRIQQGAHVDWRALLERRRRLLALNDEVRTVVAMQEVPARDAIAAKVREEHVGREGRG
jgi:energy-coupling factor transporter ATP-binding protein EcfA2